MFPSSPATDLSKSNQMLLVALVCYAVYYAYWQFMFGVQRRRLIKKYGCKPVNENSELNSWKDAFIGWTQIVANEKARKQRRLLEYFRGRFLRHGNTIHFKVAFDDIYFTAEPSNVKAMLATNFKDWQMSSRRTTALAPLLGHGIFTVDGADWQHSRDLLRPNFTRNLVADFVTFERHIGHLIQSIPRDGSTIDLQELFFMLTMDSATEFLFGESTNCLAPGASTDDAKNFANAFSRSQDAAARAGRNFPLLVKLFPSSASRKDIEYVHSFVDRYVQHGLEWQKKQDIEKSASKGAERYVFLYEFVKNTQDPVRIRSELLNVLLAGRDTTASLLGNVFFELARRPDIWMKLRKEVDRLDGKHPSFEEIKNMKYLRYVLNEALRLYPIVPYNSRMAITDTVLPLGGGPDGKSPILVPAGRTVGWLLHTIHRRQDIYGEDAELIDRKSVV